MEMADTPNTKSEQIRSRFGIIDIFQRQTFSD
jgi:hypothetical protein